MMNKYLRERGDANIKTNADLISKAKFYEDPHFPDRKQGRQAAERATVLDTSARLQTRSAYQNVLLQCMQDQRLDALVSPAYRSDTHSSGSKVFPRSPFPRALRPRSGIG